MHKPVEFFSARSMFIFQVPCSGKYILAYNINFFRIVSTVAQAT